MSKLQEFLATRFGSTKKWRYSKVAARGRLVSMIATSDTIQVVYYLTSEQVHVVESGRTLSVFSMMEPAVVV